MASPTIITVSGTQYDITKWVPYHPGGDEILVKYSGLDATDVFAAFHSKEAYEKLSKFKGVPATEPAIDKDHKFQQLRKMMEEQGLFKRNPYFYVYKTLSTLALMVASIYLVVQGYWVMSACVLGIFFQQAGWLAHDYCHHDVFENRHANNFFGRIIGNFLQGYSSTWWKDRHNTHHAITNILEADPDIDNLPIFMWTPHDFHRLITWNNKLSTILGNTLPYQAFYFLPFCATLKLIWCLQSIFWVLGMKESPSKFYQSEATLERILLAAHWICYASLFTFLPTTSSMVYYFFISQCIGGFCIAVIVFFNHYACEHLPNSEKKQTSFLELQLRSTRNSNPGILMDWFAGGLNYQIEHHLFPTMPRNNLYKASLIVKDFCKKNNLEYQCCSFLEGLIILHKHLHTVGQAVPNYLAKAKST